MLELNFTQTLGSHTLTLNETLPASGITAIFGVSGAGKTSLINAISGLTRPQSGRIVLNNRVLNDAEKKVCLSPDKRRIGYVFQDARLFPHLTVRGNIQYAERRRPAARNAPITVEIARRLEIEELLDRPVRNLSGGERSRVALARAIALDPALMLYDEPFTGLDPIALGTIAALIKQLNDALGTTAVMVTHDVHVSLSVVDHVYFVAGGRIVAGGTPDEVRRSDDPFVRQFVDGQPDGPVQLHYPADDYASQLGVGGGHG